MGEFQTGIPFGEIPAVRDWMKITGEVKSPEFEHPKRPVEGIHCTRSEVSGRRLWGLYVWWIVRDGGAAPPVWCAKTCCE